MRFLPALIAAFALCAATSTTVLAAEPKTEDEKALYALGIALSQSITSFNLFTTSLAVTVIAHGMFFALQAPNTT